MIVTLYQVTDTNGKAWGFYTQQALAQQVVDDCNVDSTLTTWAPFNVVPIQQGN